jgi:MSHA biogenesis protein MshQ
MPVQAEYWTGQGWLRNPDDNTTSIATSAVALNPNWPAVVSAGTGSVQLVGGRGVFTLGPPSTGRGTVDVALNLGASANDNSCLSSHPNTSPANLIWLRSRNGNCAATYDRDPSARATFGLSSPESRATVHVREVFN